MSQLVRNLELFISQSCHVPKSLRLLEIAIGPPRVQDTRDDCDYLREILLHKIFEHVQNFRKHLRLFVTHARKLQITATVSRPLVLKLTHECKLQAVAKQLHPSEIGAQENNQNFMLKRLVNLDP